jgi:DnaJ-class molecular chaperone
MANIHTHYDNLKVARNAPVSVIKAAYKALSQTYHPDKFQGNNEEAERITKLINTSYAVLIDPIKRANHDMWIKSKESEGVASEDVNEYAHSKNNQQKANDENGGNYEEKIHTHYRWFNISRNAQESDIQTAYLKALNEAPADNYLIRSRIHASYHLLSNPIKRAEYDAWLSQQALLRSQHPIW